MLCKICKSEKCKIIYKGKLRRGSFGNYTSEEYPMYMCENCECIWHDKIIDDIDNYYRSEEYRNDIDEKSAKDYYAIHDQEVLEKLNYTGTNIFRDKVVADIGCGAGSFLDFISGVTDKTLAVEPTDMFHNELKRKGHEVFHYMSEVQDKYCGKLDVITSFDVIEHVENPVEFLAEQKNLLKPDGKIITGTPSSAVLMRRVLGKEYEEFLYSFQHPWIFSGVTLESIAEQAGLTNIRIEYKQRYGLSNLISWLINHKPMGQVKYDYISEAIESGWKRDLEQREVADYIILYASKLV